MSSGARHPREGDGRHQENVIPAKAGTQKRVAFFSKALDSRLRGNDEASVDCRLRGHAFCHINRSSGRVIFLSGLLRGFSVFIGVSVWASSHTGSSRLSKTSRSFWPHTVCSIR